MLERLSKNGLKAICVGAAVVDRGRRSRAELLVSKLCRHGALELVVVCGAEVTGVVRPIWSGQRLVCVGRRKHDHPGLTEYHASRHCGTRAVGADRSDDSRIGCDPGRRRLAALGVAQGIFSGELDLMPEDVASLLDRDLNPPDRVIAKERGGAGSSQHIRHVYGVIRGDVYTANGVGALKRRSRLTGSQRQGHQCQAAKN